MKVMNGPHKYVFTQFEINFMKAHFETLTNPQLAAMLGHRLTLVRTRCYEMGLKRMELEYWTDDQIKFLKDNYKQYGDSELAEIFEVKWHKAKGWSKKHIEKKRRYLKLKRTDTEKAAIKERNRQMGRWALSATKRWEATGVNPIFSRVVWRQADRPFIAIKLKGGYVHYAPWLYEQIYGPVPEGMVVRLKDDNPMNVKPGNLEVITRAENSARNSRSRIPKEYRELKLLNQQLNKAIYEASNRKDAATHAEPAL